MVEENGRSSRGTRKRDIGQGVLELEPIQKGVQEGREEIYLKNNVQEGEEKIYGRVLV